MKNPLIFRGAGLEEEIVWPGCIRLMIVWPAMKLTNHNPSLEIFINISIEPRYWILVRLLLSASLKKLFGLWVFGRFKNTQFSAPINLY